MIETNWFYHLDQSSINQITNSIITTQLLDIYISLVMSKLDIEGLKQYIYEHFEGSVIPSLMKYI